MVEAQPWWTHTYHIKKMAPHTPVKSIIVWKEDTSLPAMYNPLYSSTNQQLFEKNLCNQSSQYEINRPFSCYEWKPSHAYQTIYGEQRWMGHEGEHW